MTRNKIIAVAAAGVLAVAAVVGGFFFLRSGDSGPATAKVAQVEEVPSERLPGETETAATEPLAPEVEMTTPAAQPPSSASSAPPKTAPEPSTEEEMKALSVPEHVDGCDHAYGATICVPWSFPSSVDSQKEKCAWLKQRGFVNLSVPGRDRHGLDPDKNKIACDN